jgi:hypothetical protein
MRRQAGRRDGVGNVYAFRTELIEDLRPGRVVTNAGDEGRVSAESRDGNHGGRDHASALLEATADCGTSFGRGNLAQKQEFIDTREPDSKNPRVGVPDKMSWEYHGAKG